jgi:hypothetical protein
MGTLHRRQPADGMTRLLLTSVLSAALLLASDHARANDCEAKAAEIVTKLGATIQRRSTSTIFLQHGAVPNGFTVGCDSYNAADGPDVNMDWGTNHPTEIFWSITASVGAIITGASPQVIEDGARACYKEAQTELTRTGNRLGIGTSSELTRGGIRYECTLLTDHEGSYHIDIFRRDAAKQREIDRRFDKWIAKKKAKDR